MGSYNYNKNLVIEVGRVYDSKLCGKFVIIDIVSSKSVFIKFLTTGTITNVEVSAIKAKSVGDPFFRKTYGVGYFGVGPIKAKKGTLGYKAYVAWRAMLERCYSAKYQEKRPTYKGCKVCDEWHNFQVFGLWYMENYKHGCCVDKDLKFVGNKLYSP